MHELQFNTETIRKYLWASDYIDYLEYRRTGLKDKSKLALANFMESFANQEDVVKRDFINIVFHIAYFADEYTVYLPQNLYTIHILPTILKWIEEEPDNFIPYRWAPDFEHNRKAVMLNPFDQISILRFVNRVIAKISMNQHEIEAGFPYDGDASNDIEQIKFLEPFIQNISDPLKRDEIKDIATSLKNTAITYKRQSSK
jgi:hypothetical protein